MYKFHNPDFPHTKWDDIVPGIDGAEGWYSDELYPGKRVIFFLGAWGYRDALSCMSATKEEPQWFPGIGIHSGFLRLADRAWDAIKDHLDTHKPIVFAGHSMGAAIASIIALRYTLEFCKLPLLELYAMPTIVGDAVFADTMVTVFGVLPNHTAGMDIVPRIGWLSWLLGYRSYTKNRHYKVESSLPWWERLLADHEPEVYRRTIP